MTVTKKMLTKLTLKGIGCNPSKAKAENKEITLARIYGVAGGVITKEGVNGFVSGVTGTFEAIRADDPDTRYQSGVLYLPVGIIDMLIDAVDTGEVDKNNRPIYGSVKFALELSAMPATNPIGYSYSATPLFDAEENDPLAEIRAIAFDGLKALPAPEAEEAGADAPAPAGAKGGKGKK